jgi:uncharacterized membrane protein
MVPAASRTGPPSLTAWVYHSPGGAAAGEVRLRRLRQRGAVTLEEAVTVIWAPGAHRPRVGLLQQPTPASSESLLEALCACLWPPEFAARPVGPDIAPAAARLTRHLANAGIEPGLLGEIRAAVTPGASALVVLALDVDLDAIRAVIERGRARGDVVLLHTWLAADAATHIGQARKELGAG